MDPRTTFSFTFFTLPLSGDPWRSQRRQKTPADTKMTLKWTPRLTKKTTKPTPRLTKQLRKILSTTAQDNTTITSDAFDTLMHPCPSQRIMDPPIEGTVAGWPAGLLDNFDIKIKLSVQPNLVALRLDAWPQLEQNLAHGLKTVWPKL